MGTNDVYSAFRNLENPSVPLDPYLEDGVESESKSISVTDATAKHFAPWWQGINRISSGVAQLPLLTYRRLDPRGKERAKDHPTYKVLHRRPNSEIGPFAFKELMTMQCVSRGNAYAFIERRGGSVQALWPFPIGTILPVRENGELRYVYTNEKGGQERLSPDSVFHLRGPGDDSLEGKSVFRLAKESLSGGLQAQRYAHKFFKNDASPGIVLEFPEHVDKEAAKNILKNWTSRHGGASNVNKPAFLDRGGKVSPFSISNVDAQFLESREFSRTEVASWLNLPPHFVGDLSRATFSNIEQQSLEFVVYSLMPWLLRWQDECNAKLFRTSEMRNDEYFTEFLVSALLRGDYNSRMDGHTKALRIGLMSIDELRDIENMNPLPDSLGEDHYVTLDMAPVGQLPDADEVQSEPEPDAARSVLSLYLTNELSRAYQRMGKSATFHSTTTEKLQMWLRTKLPKECEALARQLEQVSSEALKAGATGWDSDYVVAEMRSDFKNLVSEELNGDPETLKARVGGVTKRMSSDRPSELVSIIWS